nr:alpha/beta hydrolase [uncultured Rhodoferax sp.]
MPPPTDTPATAWFEAFEAQHWEVNGTQIHARVPRTPPGGRPVLLLLHGFPQSHVLWHRVVHALQDRFYVVLPDLRGYGDSAKPAGLPDHSNYSKRTLAQDMVALMDAMGVDQFHLCGHDRGGRVAHRLAVDHPARVQSLCVIDIAPTLDMYAATDFVFAQAYYHWFHLTQPSPLPETMIGGNPLAYLHAKLGGWGSAGLGYIEPAALAEYERCFADPHTLHAMCEDYRASASIDLEHDRASRALPGDLGKIACDTLVLWGDRGVVHRLFDPLALWRGQCAATVTGQRMPAGHFIPEELPQETATLLRDWVVQHVPTGAQ